VRDLLERIPRWHQFRFGVILLAAVAGIAVAASTSSGSAIGKKNPVLASSAQCSNCTLSLWGVALGPPVPLSWTPVTRFEHMVGKNFSVVPFGSPFESCHRGGCSYVNFPINFMRTVRKHGGIPILSWGSESVPAQVNEPAFSLNSITNGRYDNYIRNFAEAAAAWGRPFFLRFDWEMNGNWFPWDAKVGGQTAAEFVAAWRHVHQIFTQEGATNASWVWCPNIDPYHLWTSLRRLWPGKNYVDWTCLDGYNWGTDRGVWKTFNQLYSTTYQNVTENIAPTKPMIIGEVASNSAGGSQSAWITQMFRELPVHYPKVHGLVWWDIPDPWGAVPLIGATPGARAFSAAIRSPKFAANVFCRLQTAPITPPSAAIDARACASS
jgi:Glycosyl hydrolase family 26